MRTKGKISHWNEEKGYGFITPASGAKQVFVHLSAFSPAADPIIWLFSKLSAMLKSLKDVP